MSIHLYILSDSQQSRVKTDQNISDLFLELFKLLNDRTPLLFHSINVLLELNAPLLCPFADFTLLFHISFQLFTLRSPPDKSTTDDYKSCLKKTDVMIADCKQTANCSWFLY